MNGPSTKRSHDWKVFLCNEENKSELIVMMHITWHELVQDRQVIPIKNGEAFEVGGQAERIPELHSGHEETGS